MAVFFWMCSTGGKKEKFITNDEFESASQELASDIKTYIDNLPPPSEVPFLLMATGSDFNSDLMNPLDYAEEYNKSIDKAALNLGVYAADIGYLSSYDQTGDVYETMQVCQSLAETIGISSAIDMDLLARFESNINQRDSIANLIDEVMKVTGDRLQLLNRANLSAIALSGSFIEGLYISTMVVETYPQENLSPDMVDQILTPLMQIILKQGKTLKDLIKILNEVETNKTIELIKTELAYLNDIYNNELKEVDEKINENKGDFHLSKELLNNLAFEIKKIRNATIHP